MSDGDKTPYAGVMGERLSAPPPAEPTTTTRPRQGPRRGREPLIPRMRGIDVRTPSTPMQEPAGPGVVALIVVAAVVALIALGRLGGPPGPLPMVAPVMTSEVGR